MTRAILVTDGEQRSALAVVRSLGAAGHSVWVCSGSGKSLAGASQFCIGEIRTPDPLVDPAGFVHSVGAFVVSRNIDIIIGIAEAALLALLPCRTELAPAHIPFPDITTFRRICDKASVLETAGRLGIATPAQATLAEVSSRIPTDIPFPVVVKPTRSVSELDGRRVKVGVRYAAGIRELEQIIRSSDPAAFPLLVQQRVVGPGIGAFILRWDGRIVAEFGHQRLREKPPAGGVSVYRESTRLSAKLRDDSCRLLEAFNWRGVAMIEYKVDEESGTPYLMEINGRFWGSLQLAVDAGVDFPRLLVDAACGALPDPVVNYRIGVRSRWWWGDVDQLLTRLIRSRSDLHLPPGAPGRIESIVEFLHLWRADDRNEILQWRDPRPFVRETFDWVRRR